MTRENEHALAASLRGQVVLQPLGPYPVARIFGRVARHAAELDKLPAQVNIHAPQNSFSGFEGEFRQGKLKIAQAHTPQPPETPINPERNAAGEEARNAAGHAPQAADRK